MRVIKVVCGIIVKNGKVLLARRSATMPHPGKWEFPGGKVRAGESEESALKRELSEELDVVISVSKVLETVEWYYPGKKIGLVPVMCEIRSGQPIPKEHEEIHWFDWEELGRIDILEADIEIIKRLEQKI